MLITKKRTIEQLTDLYRRLNAREDYMNNVIYANARPMERLAKVAWTSKLRSAVYAIRQRQALRGAQ